MSLAQEEAQRFNHNYIGTEHLLLGLVREAEGVAARVLAYLGVSLGNIRDHVEFIVGRGDRMVLGEIGLTPRAKKVIELSVDEARRLNHHYIGTEHLLLGLVREREGIAAGVLEANGVQLERVRAETIRVLSKPMPQQHPEMHGAEPANTPRSGQFRRLIAGHWPRSLGPLVAVTPVGETGEANGVAVTLLSMERYATGAGHTVTIVSQDVLVNPTLNIVVSDDTDHRFTCQPFGGFGGIVDGDWHWRESYALDATIEEPATAIAIRAETLSFDPAMRQIRGMRDTQTIDRPWTFTISLEGS